ncbi:MAG: hypothetical protein ACUZ8H_02615 [Candidatus Anammoxibacter sp.]
MKNESLNLNSVNDADADVLISSVAEKYKPIFTKQNYTANQKRAIYRYFFSQRPHKLPPSLKNRLVNLYDPLADRTKRFPDGLRLCINMYVGCEHSCGYCYVNGYSRNEMSFSPHIKQKFKEKLVKDMDDIENLCLPKVPLHLSNSTDICQQKLENTHKHTLFTLMQIDKKRDLFSSVVLLTKNPSILCKEEYLSLLKKESMKPVTIQISCAFYRDEVRKFFEPDAPDIHDRLAALKTLCENGVNTELRIDPIFPSSEIATHIRKHLPLGEYRIPEAQAYDDLAGLVQSAKKSGVNTVISKPLKIPISGNSEQAKQWFVALYKDANPKYKGIVRGGSYRFPDEYQAALMLRVKNICDNENVTFKYCKHDVLTRR